MPKKEKMLPNNWTDYLIDDHKAKEIPNKTLEKFKIFVQDDIFTNFIELKEILKIVKTWFEKQNTKILKVAININSNKDFIEFLFITEISQRLFRVLNLDSNILDIELKNMNCLGDADFFITAGDKEFIY